MIANSSFESLSPAFNIADAWIAFIALLGKKYNSGLPLVIKVEPSAFKAIRCPRCNDSATAALVTVAKTSP